jgi:peptidoglycan/xylan/chitin deacetylase (PgdA/CDA1 family)
MTDVLFPQALDTNALTRLPRDFVGYGRTTPDVTWPDGSKVAVNIVVNYEECAEYSMVDGDPCNDAWGEYSYVIPPTVRDIGTESHFEFGSRVGIWRIARMLDEYRIPASIDVCALAVERTPEVGAWIAEGGYDVIGHGYRWTEDSRITRQEEKRLMQLAIESIQRTTGQRIRGWIVRSFPSVNTRELLVEDGGFLYDSDSVNDELPYFVDTNGTPFLVVPYSKVYNDVKYLIAPTFATPDDFLRNLTLGLDYLLDEARRGHGGRMMTVGVHARWTGQASRATALRSFIEYVLGAEGACFMSRREIAEHWIALYGKAGATNG